MTENKPNTVKVYNTPIEIGLRSLIILSQIPGRRLDVEALMYLDFLCLNTADIGGPESIHAPIPNRGVQVYSKKDLIQKGLAILLSKELIELVPTKDGFMYSSSQAGNLFLTYFQTKYYTDLVNRTKWVLGQFGEYSVKQLRDFLDNNLQKWGSEFSVSNNSE